MTAVDTNILIYAHRREFRENAAARRLLENVTETGDAPVVPVFCLAEFLRVVTHPNFFRLPSTVEEAIAAVVALIESPSAQVLLPGERFAKLFLETVQQARATGNLVFDAQIVALCREHGVRTIWSNDRDLARFEGIEARPLPRLGRA